MAKSQISISVYLETLHYLEFYISSLFFQLTLKATDGGYPSRTAHTRVQINVNRNLDTPTFTRSQYFVDVPVNAAVDSFIVKVEAEDTDPHVSSSYFISHQGPIVLSIISLTSSLRAQLVNCFTTLH